MLSEISYLGFSDIEEKIVAQIGIAIFVFIALLNSCYLNKGIKILATKLKEQVETVNEEAR